MKRLLTVLMAMALFIDLEAQQTLQLKGNVTDELSNPIAGVDARILNTSLSATSGSDGSFEISNLPAGVYQLLLSKEGFALYQAAVTVPSDNVSTFRLRSSLKQLDEVVVTGQKREEALQKTAISISSLSGRDVQAYRLWNARQITGIVPTLFSSNPGDNRNVTSIRGITTTSYDQAVATYVDGVNQFGLDTYIGELLDIDRIEVIRGPQSTLYGRNAMGGVINIITRQPGNKASGFAEVNAGNYNLFRATAGVRVPLIANKLYAGVAGTLSKRNGYFTNDFTGKDFERQNTFTGNYFVKYLPAANWSIDLNVKNQANRNDGPFTLINGKDQAFENPFVLSQDATTTMVDNSLNSSLSVNYKGPRFNFSSQSAYQTNYRYYKSPIDGDFAPIDGVSIINNYGKDFNKVKVFTQEIRFSSPASSRSKWNWLAGAYFFHVNNPVKQAIHFGENADMVGSPDKNFSLINTNIGKGSGYSVFGQAGYLIAPKLQLIAGARFDYEKRDLSILGEYMADGMDAPITIRPDTAGNASFNAFSPKIGLLYNATDDVSVFANYSRGFRAGGLTQLGSDPSQPPLYSFNPEYSSNYEAGVKTSFANKKVHLNATVFLVNVSDAQVPTLVLPDAITITKNAGRLESKGFEFELSATPASGFRVDYNFGYTKAVFKELKVSSNGQEADLSGNRQIFTPDMTSMLAVQYGFALNKTKTLSAYVRAEWLYLGKQYFDLANQIYQDPNSVINTKIGLRYKRLELMFWTRNLADRKYIDYAYDFGAVHLADPQTMGTGLRVEF